MSQLQVGQRIAVDLFAMRVPGHADHEAEGTIVDLGPGVITVRVERAGHGPAEVTVSVGRVQGIRG